MKTQVATRPSADVDRSPARQRLTDLTASLAEMGQRAQELNGASGAHEAAKQAEADALAALQAFVVEELIESPDEPDRKRRALLAHSVRQARAEVASTADRAAELNALGSRRQAASDERDLIIRQIVAEEGAKLAAHYHAHAQQAEAAKAAVYKLVRWLTYSVDDAVAGAQLNAALNVSAPTPEGALEFERIKAAIESYAAVWSALPDMLAIDPDAMIPFPAPLRTVNPAKLEQAA